jgi:1-deoxy-D-xylulose-5-phosphate reductoisomerase
MSDNGPVESQPREIVILGSTGSIGTQALDIVRRNPGRFRVVALAAGGGQPDLLARQAAEFGVAAVAVTAPGAAAEVQSHLQHHHHLQSQRTPQPQILSGPDAVSEVAAWPCDVVLNGVTGAAGLQATLAALDAGRVLALANKESLIVGGPLVTSRAKPARSAAGAGTSWRT